MRNSCYLHAALSLFDYMSFALHAIAAVTSNPIRVYFLFGICFLERGQESHVGAGADTISW